MLRKRFTQCKSPILTSRMQAVGGVASEIPSYQLKHFSFCCIPEPVHSSCDSLKESQPGTMSQGLFLKEKCRRPKLSTPFVDLIVHICIIATLLALPTQRSRQYHLRWCRPG
jgi:hypothetical protein